MQYVSSWGATFSLIIVACAHADASVIAKGADCENGQCPVSAQSMLQRMSFEKGFKPVMAHLYSANSSDETLEPVGFAVQRGSNWERGDQDGAGERGITITDASDDRWNSYDLLVTKQVLSCQDTPGWGNGGDTSCAGRSADECTEGTGLNCNHYGKSYCASGAVVPGKEFAQGRDFNFPAENCCVCGKEASTPEPPASTPKPLAPTPEPPASTPEPPGTRPVCGDSACDGIGLDGDKCCAVEGVDLKCKPGCEVVRKAPCGIFGGRMRFTCKAPTLAPTLMPTQTPSLASCGTCGDARLNCSTFDIWCKWTQMNPCFARGPVDCMEGRCICKAGFTCDMSPLYHKCVPSVGDAGSSSVRRPFMVFPSHVEEKVSKPKGK